jgi:PAS domain-containing protein
MNEEMDFTDAKKLREIAEKLLNEKLENEAGRLKNLNKDKLLHELQVHHIELEMQNEELRQAYETAEKALRSYTMLFDLSPVGYFSLDEDGSICDLNFTGADLLGEKRFSLLSSNFKLFISEESKPVFNNFFKNLYDKHFKESCLLTLGYNSKKCHVYMEGVVTEDEQKCFLSVVDISKFALSDKV